MYHVDRRLNLFKSSQTSSLDQNFQSRIISTFVILKIGMTACLPLELSQCLMFETGLVIFSQSGVTDVSIHPSGKLALSIGKDRKLVTWNLIKGRSAYVTNIKDMANFVKWSPTGKRLGALFKKQFIPKYVHTYTVNV